MAIIGLLFLIKLIYDGGSYVYFGFRHQSVIFSPYDHYLGKFYQVVNSVFDSNKVGLPVVKLYLPEKAQQQLLADPPRSTKKWKRGYVVFEDQELRAAKIKHRGENIRNFGHLKKSWKVKVKRKNLYQRERVFNFIVPRGDMLHDIMPYWLAEEMSLLTPKVEFRELYLNEKNHGVLLLAQQLDENFLRNSGLMPLNLYKGEPDGGDGLLGPLNDDLFNSLKGWSKQAVNNSFDKKDRSDIKAFLALLAKASSDSGAMEELKSITRDKEWVEFAVFQELAQSWHNARHANIRLLMDNWRGIVIPIPWDTTFKYRGGEPAFDRISHNVMTLHMQRSDFLLKKYHLLYKLLNDDAPLEKVALRFEKLDSALETSLARDSFFQAATSRTHGYLGRERLLREERAAFAAKIRMLSSKLKDSIGRKPVVSWSPEVNGFSLMVDREIPVADITLQLGAAASEAAPQTRSIWLDIDRDGIFSSGDLPLPFTEDKEQITLGGDWLANRVLPPLSAFDSFGPQITSVQKTRFPIRSNLPIDIVGISGQHGLTGEKIALPIGPMQGALPARWNRPVLPEPQVETVLWSGLKVVEKNTVVDKPVEIAAGTVIEIAPRASLVFRNRLSIKGKPEAPVLVTPLQKNQSWGSFALQGPKTSGSKLSHLEMTGGSGGMVQGIRYSGMFSIHDSEGVSIDHLTMARNVEYDDMLHIIYAKDVELSHVTLTNALSDAIDVDISSVTISHAKIDNAGNDAIDLMDSAATIRYAIISGAGDKGISVGEGSRADIVDSRISNSVVGIESKDGSNVAASRLRLDSNETQLSAYLKNWRYGNGGYLHIKNSLIGGQNNQFNVRKKSQVKISGSNVYPEPTFAKPSHEKRVLFDHDVTFVNEQTVPKGTSN